MIGYKSYNARQKQFTFIFAFLILRKDRSFVIQQRQKAVLLVNVGTPDGPDTRSVRRYLSQFLNDRRIMDIPWLFRKILVNLFIVPFRAPQSARLYARLWTAKGSPLLVHTKQFASALQNTLSNDYHVFTAMRYGNPSLRKTLREIQNRDFDEIIVFPLFPQYASSTVGTILDFIMKEVKRWPVIPELRFIHQFYDHPGFLRAFSEKISAYHPEKYDHIIFSYHGLPLSHINKIHPEIAAVSCTCEKTMPSHGKHCYKATCYETSRLLAQKLQLKEGQFTTAFQSRFSKNWLQPFTDEVLIQLARKGVKKVLVAVPSFVADCLESVVEIGWENRQLFLREGGRDLTLVESINDDEQWVNTAAEIIHSAGSF